MPAFYSVFCEPWDAITNSSLPKVPFKVEKAVVEDRNRNVTEEYPVLRYRTEVVEREKVSRIVF